MAGNVLKFERPKASKKFKGSSLCRDGFHKWEIETEKKFDVKQGKLVTTYRCKRCGVTKTKAL